MKFCIVLLIFNLLLLPLDAHFGGLLLWLNGLFAGACSISIAWQYNVRKIVKRP